MRIDFGEISDGYAFEDLVEVILHELGLRPVRTGVGPDGGVDFRLTETIPSRVDGQVTRTWLAQCKHNARSRRAFGEIPSIHDQLTRHSLDGYLLIVSGRVTGGVKSTIDSYNATRSSPHTAQCWTGVDLESILESRPHIARRYFPKSYPDWFTALDSTTVTLRRLQSSASAYISATIGSKYIDSIYVTRQLESDLLNCVTQECVSREDVSALIASISLSACTAQQLVRDHIAHTWQARSATIAKKCGHLVKGSLPEFHSTGSSPERSLESWWVNAKAQARALGDGAADAMALLDWHVEPLIRDLADIIRVGLTQARHLESYVGNGNELSHLLDDYHGDHIANARRDLLETIGKSLEVIRTACNDASTHFARLTGASSEVVRDRLAALHTEMSKTQKRWVEMIRHMKPVVAVIDRAGGGKTNTLCKVAQTLLQKQPCVFISAKSVVECGSGGIREHIKEGYSIEVGMPGLASDVRPPGTIVPSTVVIIDGINEHPEPRRFNEALRRFIASLEGHDVRVVVSCRDVYWDYFNDEWWDNHIVKSFRGGLHKFTGHEFQMARERYFTIFCISARLSGRAREQLHHPLLLRFFCEAYKGDPLAITNMGLLTNIRLKKLFDDYSQRKCKEIAYRLNLVSSRSIEAYIESIASKMLSDNARLVSRRELTSFPFRVSGERILDELASYYSQLRDEDIIIDEGPSPNDGHPSVSFVYEEYMEYIIARAEIESIDGTPSERGVRLADAIRRLVEHSGEFISAMGAAEYMVAFVADRYREELSGVLNTLVELQCHGAAARGIRRSDADCITGDIFEIVCRMHTEGKAADGAISEAWEIILENAVPHAAAALCYVEEMWKEHRCRLGDALSVYSRVLNDHSGDVDRAQLRIRVLEVAAAADDVLDRRNALQVLLEHMRKGQVTSVQERVALWRAIAPVYEGAVIDGRYSPELSGVLRELWPYLRNRGKQYLAMEQAQRRS